MRPLPTETKERITKAALFLFNSFGYPQVRLQHIADEAGLSVGNLAYHYANKEAILAYFYDDIRERRMQAISNLRMIPLFEPFHVHMQHQYELQLQYRFFFSDTLELIRNMPSLRKEHRSHLNWQVQQIGFFIQFNSSRGALLGPKNEQEEKQLAFNFCQLSETWFNFKLINGVSWESLKLEDYRQSLWSLFKPYMSSQGLQEFNLLNL